MTHNVWSHINAVQDANRLYDAGGIPKLLVSGLGNKTTRFKDILDDIFKSNTLEKRLRVLEDNATLLSKIKGKRTSIINATQSFNNNFEGYDDLLNSTDMLLSYTQKQSNVDDTTFNNLFTI